MKFRRFMLNPNALRRDHRTGTARYSESDLSPGNVAMGQTGNPQIERNTSGYPFNSDQKADLWNWLSPNVLGNTRFPATIGSKLLHRDTGFFPMSRWIRSIVFGRLAGCPLCPQSRPDSRHRPMSVLCHSRQFAPQQITRQKDRQRGAGYAPTGNARQTRASLVILVHLGDLPTL
jgi:hypothetical protein